MYSFNARVIYVLFLHVYRFTPRVVVEQRNIGWDWITLTNRNIGTFPLKEYPICAVSLIILGEHMWAFRSRQIVHVHLLISKYAFLIPDGRITQLQISSTGTVVNQTTRTTDKCVSAWTKNQVDLQCFAIGLYLLFPYISLLWTTYKLWAILNPQFSPARSERHKYTFLMEYIFLK